MKRKYYIILFVPIVVAEKGTEDCMKFIRTYFSDVKIELKKVTWLSKNEMLGSTSVVLIFAIIVSIFLFIVDFGITQFISRLLGF